MKKKSIAVLLFSLAVLLVIASFALQGNGLLKGFSYEQGDVILCFWESPGEAPVNYIVRDAESFRAFKKYISSCKAGSPGSAEPAKLDFPFFGVSCPGRDLYAVWSSGIWIGPDGTARPAELDHDRLKKLLESSDLKKIRAASVPGHFYAASFSGSWDPVLLDPSDVEISKEYAAEITSLDEDSMKVLVVNRTDAPITAETDMPMSLDVLIEGSWYSVPRLRSIAVPASLTEIAPGSRMVSSFTMPLASDGMYGQLPPGRYRAAAMSCIAEFDIDEKGEISSLREVPPELYFIANEYLQVISRGGDHFIAYERLQSDEIARFRDEFKRAGSTLREYHKELDEAARIYKISGHEMEALKKTSISAAFGSGEAHISAYHDEGRMTVVPAYPDFWGRSAVGVRNAFYIRNGGPTIFSMADGLYKVTPPDIAPLNMDPVYQGMTREQTQEKYRYGVTWNDRCMLSPDERHIAFASNKEYSVEGNTSLFVIDMEGREKVLARHPFSFLAPSGWLGDDHVIYGYYDLDGSGSTVTRWACVDLDCRVSLFEFPGGERRFLGAGGGKALFCGGDEILIYQIREGRPALTGRIDLPGIIMDRNDIDYVDPSGERFAVILKDNASSGFGFAVCPMEDGAAAEIIHASDQLLPCEQVFEICWIDDDELLVTIENTDEDTKSSWIYRVPPSAD